MIKRKLMMSLFLLVLLLVLVPPVSRADESASETFNIYINIVEAISIEVTEDIDFGTVEAGTGDLEAAVEAFVVGEDDYSYSVEFSDEGQVFLEGSGSGDIITVWLENDLEEYGRIGEEGQDSFTISAYISGEEIENISHDSYSGEGSVTIQYRD